MQDLFLQNARERERSLSFHRRRSARDADRLDCHPTRSRSRSPRREALTTDSIVQAVIDGRKQLMNGHSQAYLIGAARSKEINMKMLKPADKELYDASMQKEWDNWLLYRAVVPLTQAEEKSLGNDIKVIGMRWVHTD